MKFVQDLLLADNTQAWSDFLFDVKRAKKLVNFDPAVAAQVLEAGLRFDGTGWSTTRASKALHAVTNVPLVSSSVKTYLHCWLYTLALMWEIDINQVDLPDNASAGSFALLEAITGEGAEEPQDDDTGKDIGEAMVLEWEPQHEDLPKEFLYLWEKSKSGQRVDLKDILDHFPRYNQLPLRAPENNHKADGKHSNDKQLRTHQQVILHV